MITRSRVVTAIAAAVLVTGAMPAGAQDVEVKVRISPEVTREISREIQQAVQSAMRPEVRQGISEAIRHVVRDVSVVGAATARSGAWAFQNNRDFRVEQTKRETKTVAVGANGALEIRNISGDITIIPTTGAGREATIEAVYRSRGRTEADARQGLTDVTVRVDQRGERATVETVYPQMQRQSPYRVDVAFNVTAPAGTRITAASIGGNVNIRGIKGEVTASSTGGTLTISESPRVVSASTVGGDISLTGVDSDGSVDVQSVGGGLMLQQIKAKRLKAGTTGGTLTARDITCETADIGSLAGSVEYSGTLARSGRYTIHSHAGSLRFNVSGNTGFELDASSFVGEIRSDIPLEGQNVGGGRGRGRGPVGRALRGTVGDGSAYVKLTTFSGSVTVTKK
jgi:DUF4097 and DUF4098 domain-containing protein YvlB